MINETLNFPTFTQKIYRLQPKLEGYGPTTSQEQKIYSIAAKAAQVIAHHSNIKQINTKSCVKRPHSHWKTRLTAIKEKFIQL